MPSPRVTRIAILTATGVLLVFAAWEFSFLWPYIGTQDAIGTDHTFYVSIARRWLDTGQFYLPHQLVGPYVVRPDVDVLYPPISLLLFVPFVWLPYPLWWIVPGVVVGAVIWRLQPAPWTWPLLAFLVAWPRGISNVVYGNSDMWVAAAVSGGVLLGWPAVFVVIKPSVGFFALIGIRRRSWWIAAGFLAIVSLAMLDVWRQFLVAIANSDVRWWYSLEDMPPLFIPVIAWLGRRGGGFRTLDDIRRVRRPAWLPGGNAPRVGA